MTIKSQLDTGFCRRSNAKINLFLHVLGKNDSGYHNLDSLVMFTEDLFDNLTIEESDVNQILVEGQWQNQLVGKNILQTVVEQFSPYLANKKFKITLTKNIPIGAGLGGGSSNACELIKFFIERYVLDLSEKDVMKLSASIGADLPMFYYKHALYFNGIGEFISLVENVPLIWAILVYPNTMAITADVFKQGFKKYSTKIDHKYNFRSANDLLDYLAKTRNDLYENTLHLLPELSKILTAIYQLEGCRIARMSGSGSTCFGLFESEGLAHKAFSTLKKVFSDYSIYLTSLK